MGQGAYASVRTCINIYTEMEYAVKIIDKVPGHSRTRVFKEIDTFHHCQVWDGMGWDGMGWDSVANRENIDDPEWDCSRNFKSFSLEIYI